MSVALLPRAQPFIKASCRNGLGMYARCFASASFPLSVGGRLGTGTRSFCVARHVLAAKRGSRSLGTHAPTGTPKVTVDQERQIIYISPAEPSLHTSSVVFMHGLGDTANGFAQFCHDFAIDMPHVRFICPTAPTMPVTLNGGMHMPSWYDLAGLSDRAAEDCQGIEKSRETVLGLLECEAAHVGYNRCVLAGFSQGGAMALYTGLQLEQRLAGIVAMSAYLPRPGHVNVSQDALDTPVLQCHGRADPMVKFSSGKDTEKFLISHGVRDRTFHEYMDLGHSVDDEEVQDVRDWLMDKLPQEFTQR